MSEQLNIANIKGVEAITVIQASDHSICSVVFSPNGNFVLTGSRDKTAKLWDIVTGREVQQFIGHSGPVFSISLSPDENFVASGSGDKTTRLWNLANGDNIWQFKVGTSYPISAVTFSPNSKTILTGSGDTTITADFVKIEL